MIPRVRLEAIDETLIRWPGGLEGFPDLLAHLTDLVLPSVYGVRGSMEPGSQLSPANSPKVLHRSFPLVKGRSSPRATDSGTENE